MAQWHDRQTGFLGCAALLSLGFTATTLLAQQPVGTAAPAVLSATASTPIAIVPIGDSVNVTGALQVTDGKALIATAGTVSSTTKTTNVVLPQRGTLRVCASSTIKLTSDTSVPAGEVPGLMMALDRGSIEADFATGRNSDIVLTPDFRILIGGPGPANVKIRLGPHGDTCVDNAGVNAPYVLVSSVFDGGAYRVQPGQRVMFEHGDLRAVVDQEKEPCGCPPEARPGTNDFPLAQSAGLAPAPPVLSTPPPNVVQAPAPALKQALVYQGDPAEKPAAATAPQSATAPQGATAPQSATAPQAPPAAKTPAQKARKHTGFFKRVGGFFRKFFGAD